MKTRCLHSYCLLAVASATGVEGLSSHSHSFGTTTTTTTTTRDDMIRTTTSLHPPSCSANVPSSLHEHRPRLRTTAATTTTTTTSRREVFQSTKSAVLGAFCGWILAPKLRPAVAAADVDTTTTSFVQGTVTVPADYNLAETLERLRQDTTAMTTPQPALYITCRPDRPDNVPQAILEGSRGKAPPVLTARIENPTFPLSFQLTRQDLTPEGGVDLWWQHDDLTVSARLDMDGIAATRSPDDLVGRGMYYSNNSQKEGDTTAGGVVVALGGRGAFGKFATKK